MKKTAKQVQAEPQGLSYLDMQRRAAEEEGRLLDELLGDEKDKDRQAWESPGTVLARRQTASKDEEFTDKLRRVEERIEPSKPYVFGDAPQSGTLIEDDKLKKQKAMHEAWQSIGSRMKQAFALERPDYYEKALAAEMTKAQGIDVLA